MLDRTQAPVDTDEVQFTDSELEIFSRARAAGTGIRRSFDSYVIIARAVRVARDHADALGGSKKAMGHRFRIILNSQGLEFVATNEAYQLLKILSRLDEVNKWRAEQLTEIQRVRWASPQSVINRAPCFRPDGKIRGPASLQAQPMTLNEFLRQPASDAALLLHRRCAPKFFALLHAMTELAESGSAVKPVSGWAVARERERPPAATVMAG